MSKNVKVFMLQIKDNFVLLNGRKRQAAKVRESKVKGEDNSHGTYISW